MTQMEGEQSKGHGRSELPSGARVRVMADTDEIVHFVLPVRPDALSPEQLDQVAAGGRGKDTWPDPKRTPSL